MSNLKNLREKHSLSTIHLARLAKMTRARIEELEYGTTMTEQELRKLERAYLLQGVDALDELINAFEESNG